MLLACAGDRLSFLRGGDHPIGFCPGWRVERFSDAGHLKPRRIGE